MSDGPNMGTWPPTEIAGTTTPRQRLAGGWGLPKELGGGTAQGERLLPDTAPDKTPDMGNRYAVIRWRDNKSAVWSKEHIIDLGQIGPVPLTLTIKRLGVYRSRQWELVAQSAVPFVFLAVEEEIEFLGS